MEQELSNCPSADRTFLSSTFPNTHSLAAIIMRHQIYIGIFLLFTTLTKVVGQSFSDCGIEGPIFITVQQPSTFKGSLNEYFENEFKGQLQDYLGLIQLKILVDTSGKSCLLGIETNTSTISKTRIINAINKMTGWSPAYQNNHFVNFAVVLRISFLRNKIKVEYLNEKPPVLKPIINPNTINNPEIVKEHKVIWKLWNFKNSMIPSNLSRNVGMDSNGVIWYCTDNGLVKIIDDNNWEIFNGMNVPALAGINNTTWTTGMAIDKANNVWIESGDHIVKYDGEQWTTFDTTNSPLKSVHKIRIDKNACVWFCTFRGLIKYDGKTWTKYTRSNSKLVSDNIKDVYIGNDETIWIATDKGINKVVNDNWSLLNEGNSNIPENDFSCIKGDLNGNIWAGIGTKDKYYLIKIDTSNNVNVNISTLISSSIWNITIDNKTNKVWLATQNGLVAYDGKEFVQYDNSNSIIRNNIISDILIDQKGNKWISTFGGLVFTNTK